MKAMEIYVGDILVKYKRYYSGRLSKEEYEGIKKLVDRGEASGVLGAKGWWIICKEYRKNEYVV